MNSLFTKINKRKKPAFFQLLVSVFLSMSFVFLTIFTVYAYFTSKASSKGEVSFGNLEVNLLDTSNNTISGEAFATQSLSNIIPGSEINLSNIKVSNTGSHDEYVLMNVNAKISKTGANDLEYSIWYNVFGEEVNVNNFAINVTEATYIKSSEFAITNIKWKVPGLPLTSEYIGANLDISIAAYGVQTFIPGSEIYENKSLFASYFICKNANDIILDTDTNIPYKSLNILTEPNKKIYSKNLIDSTKIECLNVSSAETGYGFKISNLSGKYVFSCTGSSTQEFSYKLVTNKEFGTKQNLTNGTTIDITSNQTLILYSSASENWADLASIQLEKGASATSFEEPKVHSDEVNYIDSTITKNIKTMVLDGSESWEEYSSASIGKMFFITIADKVVGDKFSQCSHFVNTTACWDSAYMNTNGIYSEYTTDNTIYFRSPNPSITSVELFAEWVSSEYQKGTPVTIWYKTSVPTTEKFYTTKNFYSSAQTLVFNTSADVLDTTDENATIQFGDADLVKYLSSKNFVVSALIKLDATDKAKLSSGERGFDVKITYVNATNGNKSTTQTNILKLEDYGKNIFISLNNNELLSLYSQDQLQNVTAIKVELRSFNSSTYSNFTIKNIQLELGSSPTDFEAYDATEYARVNGVALRQVNGVKDIYDVTTGTITRYIGITYLVGSESEIWEDHTYNEYNSYKISIANKKLGFQTSVCSHFENVTQSWASSDMGVYSDNSGDTRCYFKEPNNTITNLEEFKLYLSKEKENGTPVTLWYQLATSTTQEI